MKLIWKQKESFISSITELEVNGNFICTKDDDDDILIVQNPAHSFETQVHHFWINLILLSVKPNHKTLPSVA